MVATPCSNINTGDTCAKCQRNRSDSELSPPSSPLTSPLTSMGWFVDNPQPTQETPKAECLPFPFSSNAHFNPTLLQLNVPTPHLPPTPVPSLFPPISAHLFPLLTIVDDTIHLPCFLTSRCTACTHDHVSQFQVANPATTSALTVALADHASVFTDEATPISTFTARHLHPHHSAAIPSHLWCPQFKTTIQ